MCSKSLLLNARYKDMKKDIDLKNKLRSNPYKGVLTEIATEQDVSLQAVWNAVHVYQNPRIITILYDKMKQRKSNFQRTQKQLAEFAN